MKPFFPLLAAMLAICVNAAAQQSRSYDEFMAEAGVNSVLYRGHRAMQYEFRCNGHQYWGSRSFERGSVEFNGKSYDNILLNIDCCNQDLVAIFDNELAAVVLDHEHIGEIHIGDRRFALAESISPIFPTRFVEIFDADGIQVYRCRKKDVKKSSDAPNPSKLGYEVDNFNFNVNQYFMLQESWYTERKGELRRIGRRKALKMIGNETR